MRSIKAHKESADFQRIFKFAKSSQSKLVVWQVDDGRRDIYDSVLVSFHLDAGKLHFQLTEDGIISVEFPLYCYSEDSQFIFKSKIIDSQGQKFSATVPDEIMLLDEPDITSVRGTLGISTNWVGRRYGGNTEDLGNDFIRVKSMSQRSLRDQDFLKQEFMPIDEEDEVYADLRQSPRARPKSGKKVKIKVKELYEALEFTLFDLSRGGVGFLVDNEFMFVKGMEIQVLGFDEFNLDDPLVGQVMGIRPLDEKLLEFKVGVQFSEGQD